MKTRNKDDTNSLWTWNHNKKYKKRNGKQFPVTEFLQDNCTKLEEVVMGPGGGAGIGCGIGVGFGLVGGVGFSGWPWNHLKLAVGVGAGCGVGLGFGYGGGLGHGFSLDSLENYMSNKRKDSKTKGIVLDY